jgi:hypothetical protein
MWWRIGPSIGALGLMSSGRSEQSNWALLLYWLLILTPAVWVVHSMAAPSQIAQDTQIANGVAHIRFWSACVVFALSSTGNASVLYVNWRRPKEPIEKRVSSSEEVSRPDIDRPQAV